MIGGRCGIVLPGGQHDRPARQEHPVENIPCCPDSPLCQPPAEPAARAIWHLEQERLERAWLDDHITEHLALRS